MTISELRELLARPSLNQYEEAQLLANMRMIAPKLLEFVDATKAWVDPEASDADVTAGYERYQEALRALGEG
jgi:hypothetical protein